MVRIEHATSLAVLVASAALDGSVIETDYTHTSNLPQGRALWLRRAIESSADYAISIDSDTEFDGAALVKLLASPGAMLERAAVIGAPVRIGGTLDALNVCVIDDQGGERRATHEETVAKLEGDHLVASVGFGLVAFRLDWYREHWRDVAPERCAIDTSEDIEHCRSVRRRGGLIAIMPIHTRHLEFRA